MRIESEKRVESKSGKEVLELEVGMETGGRKIDRGGKE